MENIGYNEMEQAKILLAMWFKQQQDNIDAGYMYDLNDADKIIYLGLKLQGY